MDNVTSIRKNQVAGKLALYFQREGLDYFHRREIRDEEDTILFLTALPAGPHRLLCAIITDASVYTIVRVSLGKRNPNHAEAPDFLEFLRKLNANHAFFKYAINQDGGLFLDVCVPAVPKYFDPNIIRTTMNLIVYHLGEEYESIAKWLDVVGDANAEVNM